MSSGGFPALMDALDAGGETRACGVVNGPSPGDARTEEGCDMNISGALQARPIVISPVGFGLG